MNWQEIAGGLINALRNAGVKKDVIDLQEKQVALLTKEIARLTSVLKESKTERASLQSKMADLEKELDRLRPKTGGLDEMQIKFLQLLFNHDELPIEFIAQQLGISEGMANHHCDVLLGLEMIHVASIGMKSDWMDRDKPTTYEILPKGRTYLVENKLV